MSLNSVENFYMRLKAFLFAFFYELECSLKGHIEELEKIKFLSEEANTDEYFKKYIKNHILTHLTKLPLNKLTHKISLHFKSLSGTIDSEEYLYDDLSDFEIIQVLLPSEISDSLKEELKAEKSAVYTNPDVLLKVSNGTFYKLISIELKSTKNNSIPGSSVQQVNPHEWVIFYRHGGKEKIIATGQYKNAISGKMQFPDRSPRPQVAINTLINWNKNNRILETNNLLFNIHEEEEAIKIELLSDWQESLAKRWIDVLKADRIKSNEAWFNNALRKFILKFIDFLDRLSPNDLSAFKAKLKRLISEYEKKE